ncbi:MAG: anti-sigma factor family protein [Chthonomonadales bacterium]
MNCKRAQFLLSEYLNNTLPACDAMGVQRHLAECNECARAFHELRRTVRLLADARRYCVPDTFGQDLQQRLAKMQPRRGLWARLDRFAAGVRYCPRWSLGLAAAALGAVFVYAMGLPFGAHPNLQSDGALEASIVRDAFRQNVALSAADPFADLAAANLTAHASNSEADARSSLE